MAPAMPHIVRRASVTQQADQHHDRDATPRHRFYTDLASWWPLISAPEEYAEEAAFAASLLRAADPPTRTVRELGSGGGNNAFHLKREFQMTLADVSEDMLAVSRELNPDCEHVRGDMRTLRLGRSFDAVFVHDAIDYMTTEADLRRAVATAYEHCRVRGVAVLVPDNIAENFQPETDHGGHDAPDGRGARYLSWSTDPDPDDTWTRADYAFLLRSPDGTVTVAQDTHHFGLFPRALWLQVLTDAGFRPRSVAEVTSEERPPREFFVGIRV
jgi:SAM-dependent methyltransferase